MARLWDWSERLEEVVRAHRACAFAWGQADCLMFAGRCVEAVRGDNPAEQFRGTYDDEKGAAKVLLKLGARNAPDVLAGMFPQKAMGEASRGDLAVLREPTAEDPFGAIGVVLGAVIAGYGPDGLHLLPLTDAVRIFEVD